MGEKHFCKVYIADIGPLEDKALYARALEKTSGERRGRIERMRSALDKRRSLGAEALLRLGLEALGERWEVLTIARTREGKPYLPERPSLHFSLSHSGEKVMCALADRRVGCDVEALRGDRLAVAERFFTPEEYALLAGAREGREREALFFRLWTLKESYMKAKGMGLCLPMNRFTVRPAGKEAGLVPETPGEDFALYPYPGEGDYCCACCLEHPMEGEWPALTPLSLQSL